MLLSFHDRTRTLTRSTKDDLCPLVPTLWLGGSPNHGMLTSPCNTPDVEGPSMVLDTALSRLGPSGAVPHNLLS